MDAKDSRAEATLTERSSDGGAKFTLQYDRSKCHDAGASAFKGDVAGARPCAVIGPDRVVPPARDCPKKPPAEPWLTPEPVYRRLSDYPHKMSDHKDPARNISPRQTFQENMQRIIMPPGYNAIKMHEDPAYASKNNKLNVPLEVKYCDVPYNINPISSDQKHIRNTDHSASNVNPLLMRGVPHGWPTGSVNVRPLRPYGAPEVLQYPDYTNCPGPRPMLTRTHSSGQDELQQLYADTYYHENNVRFKPYPNIKERYPQARYEYIGNYPNPYHPPHSYAHKYELPKTMPPHTYSGYPPVPVKYTERVSEPIMDSYQRAFTQQANYTVPIRNPVIHSPYRPVPGTQMQNKLHPYPPDGQHKLPVPNKLPYDPSSKMYLDYDTRSKPLPMTDNYYLNEIPRPYHTKNIVLPNYGPASMHGVNPHPYYIKEMAMKNYEYAHFKNMDPSMINHSLTKLPPQFSPSTLAISPADSNVSNETAQTHGTSQEDCGYVSQSSVASVRSIESLNRIPMDLYGRYDYRYGPVVQTSPSSKRDPNSSQESKSKKDIRQFISSWSEGDDENTEGNSKRDGVKTIPDSKHNFCKQYEGVSNQEQLYVLGLVNVPSEELSKYEHIQKVSKLPENIKGYNSLELLNQFEEAIESSNITSVKPPTPRAIQMPLKSIPHKQDPMPRAVSPLDVESKISQSVIHKDVGCNFEIKPCSPKMLNVEVATPMQTLLNERVIEKVANPHNIKPPIVLQSMDESIDSVNQSINKSLKCPIPNTASSCKMINSQHLSEPSVIDNLKSNYCLQDLESNSGVCLASLPRLDTDIELNFPEVNQQFINANKTESVITASFTKDLPALDADRSGSASKNTEYDMNYQFSPRTETETDFSKLSKYRKLKKSVPDCNNTALAKAQATRVDSVIIKNPDNIRSPEENNETSGGYYKNDFQEFAMNLVSQVKTSKTNHENEMDKMFNTSASNTSTSKYDEINIHSPSDFLLQKSGNVISKHLNEVEEINNVVHIQTEDLSIHYKDLSNRYLDKGALDIPMNLSPKAKYSSNGIDEEMKNNRSNDHVDAVADVNHQFVENNSDNKNSEEIQKYTSAVSLDKTDDTVLDSRQKNLNADIGEEPIIKLNNVDTCSSSDFSKDRDVKVDKKDHIIVSHIEKVQRPSIITTYDEEEIVFEKEIDALNLQENITKSKKEGYPKKNVCLDKGEHTDKVNDTDLKDSSRRENDDSSKIYRKKYNSKSHVSKLRRKKHKTDITHRRQSPERSSAPLVGDKTKNKVKDRNKEKTSFCSEILDSGKHSINGERYSISDGIIIEGQNKTESSLRSEYKDKIKKETTNILNVDNVPKNYSKENNVDISRKLKNDCYLIKDNMLLPCLPREDECCKLLIKNEREVLQTGLSMDVDNIVIKDDNKNTSQGVMSSTTELKEDGPIISSNSPKGDVAGTILPSDQLKSKEKASQANNACIDSIEKEIPTPTVSDEYEINSKENVINASFDSEHKELYTGIISNEEDREHKDKLISIHRETDELDTPVHAVENEREIKSKQSCDEFQRIPFKNEDQYQDVQMQRIEDNSFKVYSQDNTKVLSQGNTPHHPSVKKELFSPRFQNLLVFNENYDISYGVIKSKTTGIKCTLQNPETISVSSVVQEKIICSIHEVGISADTLQLTNVTTDDSNLILHSHNDTELTDKLPEEITEEKPDENLDAKSTEEIYDNSTNTVYTFKEGDKREIHVDNKIEPVSDLQLKLILHSQNDAELTDKLSEEITDEKTDESLDAKSTEEFYDSSINADYTFKEGDKREIPVDNKIKPVSEIQLKLILHSQNDAELTDKLSDEITDEKTNESLDAKCSEEFYDSSINADYTFKEGDKREILVDDKEKTVLDIHLNSHENVDSVCGEHFDKREEAIADTFKKSVENVVVKSPGEDIIPEGDVNLENSDDHKLVTGSTDDNVATDTCEANLIVIDENTSVTPGSSIDYESSKIDTVDGGYDFDKKIQSLGRNLSGRPRYALKRSLSDSALNTYDDNFDNSEKRCFMLPKRKKVTDISNIDESHLLNIIQSSRRNSISTLCNEKFSFCILIDDNCIVSGENYEQENEFIEFDNVPLDPVIKDSIGAVEKCPSPVYNAAYQNENNSDSYITKCDEEKSWVEDVGCEEIIETEDIAENIVIGEPASPKDTDISDYESDDENIGVLNNDVDHTSKVKHIYGDNMCTNDAQLVDTLYRTPQMDVNRKLMDRESQITERNTKYYDSDSLEMMLSEPINSITRVPIDSNIHFNSVVQESNSDKENKDSTCSEVLPYLVSNLLTNIDVPNKENSETIKGLPEPIVSDKAQDEKIQSCESSLDNVFSYIHKDDSSYSSSNSPEVSSTTSEEKNSSILLKISNFKGSRTSEVKNITQKEISCKFTEKEYMNPNYNNGTSTNRPLLTKAAQKYIPPLKESIPDLKVKLALPKQSLLKLQKNKVAKAEPKFSARSSTYSNTSNVKPRKEIPKKIKPKFEDVLKNIDEVQFQMHKEKNKKTKKYIPKVVIKKTENGSHYASTSSQDAFNPDLTGRKWQPWVFIEKNQFIDKMALRNKTRAVFSHRRKSFVLPEKVCRYKSISSAKFIISQPKINDFCAGNLKYTIKLKHTY